MNIQINLKSFLNPYGLLVLLAVLVAASLAFFSPQGLFVGFLLLLVAAHLRLQFTHRQIAKDQLVASRELASWIKSVYSSNNALQRQLEQRHDGPSHHA